MGCTLSIDEPISIMLATLCFGLADVSVLILYATLLGPDDDGFCINESLSDMDRKPGGNSKPLFLFCWMLNEAESASMVFDISVPGNGALPSLAGTSTVENTLLLSTADAGINVENPSGGI